MESLWSPSLPLVQILLRAVVVYAFVLLLLRLSGKRQIGQMGPAEFVALLLVSNAVQNSMNGGDNSVLGGIISAVTLISLNFLVGYLTYRSKRLEALLEGQPEVLIHNGKLFEKVMARAQLTHHELNAALRRSGCSSVAEVHSAILENNGAISVVAIKDKADTGNNRGNS